MNQDLPNLIARAADRLRQLERAPKGDGTATDPHGPVPEARDIHSASKPESSRPADTLIKKSRLISLDYKAIARRGIILPSAGRSRAAEEIRIIKGQVLGNALEDMAQRKEERSQRLIMVTSSRPAEGKTFTAVNLALSIASERDLTVLLIDADATHPALPEVFGFESGYGLLDLLANPSIDFSDAVLRTPLPNLAILPGGKAPPTEVPELLSSKRMGAFVSEVEKRYPNRFIIFDAAPCLASSEPAVLAGLVGQIVFVIEAYRTQQEEIKLALNLIRRCPKIGFVLNKMDGATKNQFGSFSKYFQQRKA